MRPPRKLRTELKFWVRCAPVLRISCCLCSFGCGQVVSAKAKGKIKGEGELSLTLTSTSVQDHTYEIQTSVLSSTAKGKGKRTAVATGGGAAGGALIGGIAGGGKGAGIGALIGAGAGLIGGAATGNKQVEIPTESALRFTLKNKRIGYAISHTVTDPRGVEVGHALTFGPDPDIFAQAMRKATADAIRNIRLVR